MSTLQLTGDELLVLHDGIAARLLDFQERYGTQAAVLAAEIARPVAGRLDDVELPVEANVGGRAWSSLAAEGR